MGTHEHHHKDAVTQAGIGMDGAQLPEQKPQEPTVREGHDGPTELGADPIPVQWDEETAEELAMKAYGDEDDDGNPDIPNIPLPG